MTDSRTCAPAPPTIALRRAQSADAAALSALMTQTFLAAYGHVAPAASLQRHIAANYAELAIARALDAGEIEVWIADASSAQASTPLDCGYLQLCLHADTLAQSPGLRALEVQRCYLRPEYIGSGAGTLLMQRAQQRAIELGADALHLSAYQQAPRAVRFYEKHGFQIAAAVKFSIGEVEFDDWLMVWHSPR